MLNERENALPNSPHGSRPTEPGRDDAIRVVFVDDDDDYREAAATELDYLGFKVTSFATGEAMLDHLRQDPAADVILLDWKLQTGLGIDFLPQLHDGGFTLPVVFLASVPTTAHEYAALDRGAVDFVDKARGIPILAKRLRLIVETSRGTPNGPGAEALQSGPLQLRPDIGRAYWKNQDIDLTLTEFKIVFLLVSRAGEYVTYRSIYDCVHHAGFVAGSGEDGFRTNVRSSIKRIRNKFHVLDAGFSEIENYPAFGYRWRGVATPPA